MNFNPKNLLKEAEHRFEDRNNTGTIIAALVAGVAIGAIVGILFAPEKGTETRSNLSDSLQGLGNTIADKARQGKESINTIKDKAVNALKNQGANIQEEAGKA
ncbi:YtxH domain-containing protein [Rubrolithibacter danxiaensis]|uniref:YtxH domain-containing protein n=1 Tax=Rubrolithibacter danxiaensis TaxID=3390805 RepID=UPI003BF88754